MKTLDTTSPLFKVEWLQGFGENVQPAIHKIESFRDKDLWGMSIYMGEDWEKILLSLTVGEFYDSIVMTEHVRFTRIS